MEKKILSISGRPGLYELVSQGKNMLIVESLDTRKRTPVHSRDKVVSIGDVSIYTADGGDRPLTEVFEAVRAANDSKAVDVKAKGDDRALREYFREIMPDFDDDRVKNSDIKKLFQWYNILVQAGITDFVDEEPAKEEEAPEEK